MMLVTVIFLPDSRLSYSSTSSPVTSTPPCPVAKRRQRLWQTISLLIAYFSDNDRRSVHYPNSLGCALSSKYVMFAAEEGGIYKDQMRN